MSNFLRWFIFIAFVVFCIGFLWIYKTNTVEQSSVVEVLVRGRIYVSVTTEPPDVEAEIFFNGEDTGQTAPAVLKVAPGSYLIRVETEGYKPAEEEVIVKTLKTTAVNFVLQPL